MHELLHIIGHSVIAMQLTVGGISMVSKVLEEMSGIIERKLVPPTHDGIYRGTQVPRQCSGLISAAHQRVKWLSSLTDAPVILLGAKQSVKDDQRRIQNLWS